MDDFIPSKSILCILTFRKKYNIILDPSPKPLRSNPDKDSSLLSTTQTKGSKPASPKPLTPELRKSLINNANERDSLSIITDPIYSNVQLSPAGNKQDDISNDNEGDLIEHDILSLVAEEQKRDSPPSLPVKKRTVIPIPTIPDNNHNTSNLDIHIEPTPKLVHAGKNEFFIAFFFRHKEFCFRKRSSSSCKYSSTSKTIND